MRFSEASEAFTAAIVEIIAAADPTLRLGVAKAYRDMTEAPPSPAWNKVNTTPELDHMFGEIEDAVIDELAAIEREEDADA